MQTVDFQSLKQDWHGLRQGTVAALDIGTTKICCFIAKCRPDPHTTNRPIRVIGVGHQVSHGVRKGAVIDMDPVEDAIRHAVEGAERMTGTTVRRVYLNLSAGAPSSRLVSAHMPLPGQAVTDEDLTQVLVAARNKGAPDGRTVVHAIPSSYTIDGVRGVNDPRGMFGERLGVTMHVATAARAPIQNLALCVERCHLELGGFVLSPYAAALSCLVGDEADLGAICIDMGGGTTSFSIFHESTCVYTDVVPVGGLHITNDIARGLSTSLAMAERLKTLFGSAFASPTDHREMIDAPQVGEDKKNISNHVPRSLLTGIIQPRLEEIFELVRDRLKASGLEQVVGKRMILTGGASQLNGARELATRILNKNVRMGRPLRLSGMPDAMAGPAFATVSGLLEYAFRAPPEAMLLDYDLKSAGSSSGQWLNFKRWFKGAA